MILMFVGDVVLFFVMFFMVDGFGCCRVFFVGGLLMVMFGVVFVLFENFWVFLFVVVIGVISVFGGDFGFF